MLTKRIQIGLIHVAVAMTLVPINSTLNRVMIKELSISAALVAILASLPYLFSPIQVAIGSFSDRHPLFGWRRTGYIFLGLVLCVVGVVLAPYVAFMVFENQSAGILLGTLAFGAWGMGYNLAAVSYFSLATEISGEKGRSRTIAVMFFMMIVGIILTSYGLGALLHEYTPAALERAFAMVGMVALILGMIGLLGLEERNQVQTSVVESEPAWGEIFQEITGNRQVTLFFWYLILLLTAILGQDILLEPFGAEAFDLGVSQTTRITSIWGTFFLIALTVAGLLERRVSKFTQARIGAWAGMAAFSLIVASGWMVSQTVFYLGVVLLGLATGLSTVSNLSLMLDMTTVEKVGLYIGVWGMANSLSRLIGNLLSGLVRDVATQLSGQAVLGYILVFIIEIFMLLISLVLLKRVDVYTFKKQAEDSLPYTERAAIANEGT